MFIKATSISNKCQYFRLFFLLLQLVFLFKPGPLPLRASEPVAFPEIVGWKISKDIQIYNSENLYEYIDGAAELYLSYDFQELLVAEYANEGGSSVIIEVYRHGTPVHAFGIYSRERPVDGEYLKIGSQGYIEAPVLNFLVGNAYVKMFVYDIKDNVRGVLRTFALKIAESYGGSAELPEILKCFPERGKIANSEKFIANGLLSHEFLHTGFTAGYKDAEREFELFIIEGKDSKDCDEMLRQYMKLTGYPWDGFKKDTCTLPDPYHGSITLSRRGKYIWGVKGLDDKEMRLKYLSMIEERLPASN